MYELSKVVPIPENLNTSKRVGRKATKYPFHLMSVGDSFFVPCSEADGKRIANTVRSNAKHWTKRSGKRGWVFKGMYTHNGFRCWRVK